MQMDIVSNLIKSSSYPRKIDQVEEVYASVFRGPYQNISCFQRPRDSNAGNGERGARQNGARRL